MWYTGSLDPVFAGRPWTETLLLKSDDDGQPLDALILEDATWTVRLGPVPLSDYGYRYCGSQTTDVTVAVPEDGTVILSMTAPVCAGSYGVSIDVELDGSPVERIASLYLPVLPV